MIGRLSGTLIHQDEQSILIDVGGVGYQVFVGDTREQNMGEIGKPILLWIHTHVREDQITLFGFRESLQKKIFLILTGINGIGPKLAMAVVCQLAPHELVDAVNLGNTKRLRGISGVGPKMADRMVLELKDKLAAMVKVSEWTQMSAGGDKAVVWGELSQALAGLGFGDQKIRNVIKLLRVDLDDPSPEINQLLKLALQKIQNC